MNILYSLKEIRRLTFFRHRAWSVKCTHEFHSLQFQQFTIILMIVLSRTFERNILETKFRDKKRSVCWFLSNYVWYFWFKSENVSSGRSVDTMATVLPQAQHLFKWVIAWFLASLEIYLFCKTWLGSLIPQSRSNRCKMVTLCATSALSEEDRIFSGNVMGPKLCQKKSSASPYLSDCIWNSTFWVQVLSAPICGNPPASFCAAPTVLERLIRTKSRVTIHS